MDSMLLTKLNFSFFTEGTLVCMQIGDTVTKMDHATAFRVAASLSAMGHRIKRLVGDNSMHWNIDATLTDANADALEEQLMRDGTAALVPRSILTG